MSSPEDASKQQEALLWMEKVLEKDISRDKPFPELMKNGVLLCELINKLRKEKVIAHIERGSLQARVSI